MNCLIYINVSCVCYHIRKETNLKNSFSFFIYKNCHFPLLRWHSIGIVCYLRRPKWTPFRKTFKKWTLFTKKHYLILWERFIVTARFRKFFFNPSSRRYQAKYFKFSTVFSLSLHFFSLSLHFFSLFFTFFHFFSLSLHFFHFLYTFFSKLPIS